MSLLRTLTPVTAIGHSDFTYDSLGYEVLVYVDEYKVKTYRLATGLITEQLPATHMASNMYISCRNTGRPGYCYISTWQDNADETTKYMFKEIFAMNLDGSGKLERWSQNFGAGGVADLAYNRQAHGVPNRLGTQLMIASDFGDASGTANIEAYIIEMAGTVPHFEINYYRRDTGALVLTDNSIDNINGDFQYYNGTTWVDGIGPDVLGTRRRYVPSAGLPSGVDVKPKIRRS